MVAGAETKQGCEKTAVIAHHISHTSPFVMQCMRHSMPKG